METESKNMEPKRPSLPALLAKLTTLQKSVLDKVWNHHLDNGRPYPARSLQRDLGKIKLGDAIAGLSGGLLFETVDNGTRCYKLTMLGALLTGHGNVLLRLLLGVLQLVREVFEADGDQVDSHFVTEKLRLTSTEAHFLFRVLSLGLQPNAPIFIYQTQGEAWNARITDDVTNLYTAEDISKYFEELLLAYYSEKEPHSHNDRLRNLAASNRSPMFDTGPLASDRRPTHAYVSAERIREIRALSSTRFDFSRLILMCNELNDCANRENAHAVIMLTRAILDHIPPVFGFKSFSEVVSNYKGRKSFKDAIGNLDALSRKIADLYLHSQIRKKESLPNMTQVNFSAPLDLLLAEVVTAISEDQAKRGEE